MTCEAGVRIRGAGLRRQPFTLTEILIATSIGVIVAGMVLGFVVMGATRLKSGQNQVKYNHWARYSGQRLTSLVQNARLAVSAADGMSALVVQPNDVISRLYYADGDGVPGTLDDDAIWYDPDTEVTRDEHMLVRHATPLHGEPVFSQIGAALVVRFHVGDVIGSSARSDLLTGPGYQGLQVRVVATPRNIGQIWTGGGFE